MPSGHLPSFSHFLPEESERRSMMEMNEELMKSEFFDLVNKGESDPLSLTPVGFIDPIDLNNNNAGGITTQHSKSFLDEILLNSEASSVEFMGTLQWSHNGLDPSPQWNPGDGEVTTLTNLLDPLFVSFDQDSNKLDWSTTEESLISSGGAVISSDLISTTFLNDSPPSSSLLEWPSKSEVTTTSANDDSLLRTALQSQLKGQVQGHIIPTTVLAKEYSPSQGHMTELRKVLSFPPLRNDTSPTPSDCIVNKVIISDVTLNSDPGAQGHLVHQPYYELKVLDSVFVEPEAVIPNVEELILTRIERSSDGGGAFKNFKKLSDISADERKINSTTLSAKWTYTTKSNSDGSNKRKRTKKAKTTVVFKDGSVINSNSDMEKDSEVSKASSSSDPSSGSESQGALTRKERSLHYCNICCKGFKDKYSVNVHVRTHTGEKPFSCTLCGKSFRQKAHLAKHYQTHAAKANGGNPKGLNKRIIHNSSNMTQNLNANANSNSSSGSSPANNITSNSTTFS